MLISEKIFSFSHVFSFLQYYVQCDAHLGQIGQHFSKWERTKLFQSNKKVPKIPLDHEYMVGRDSNFNETICVSSALSFRLLFFFFFFSFLKLCDELWPRFYSAMFVVTIWHKLSICDTYSMLLRWVLLMITILCWWLLKQAKVVCSLCVWNIWAKVPLPCTNTIRYGIWLCQKENVMKIVLFVQNVCGAGRWRCCGKLPQSKWHDIRE